MKGYMQYFFLLLTTAYAGCTSGDLIGDCTDEFVVITIEVEDNQGDPVVFDSVAVNRESDNFLFEFSIEINTEPGTYILMTDKYHNDLSNEGTSVLFAGFNDRNSFQLVASYEYSIKKGICHVEKVSGDDVIVLP